MDYIIDYIENIGESKKREREKLFKKKFNIRIIYVHTMLKQVEKKKKKRKTQSQFLAQLPTYYYFS